MAKKERAYTVQELKEVMLSSYDMIKVLDGSKYRELSLHLKVTVLCGLLISAGVYSELSKKALLKELRKGLDAMYPLAKSLVERE